VRLEDLQVDLQPRAPRQALDLGTWILARHAAKAWAAWAAAWLPLVAIAMALCLIPYGAGLAGLFLWWIRPLPERVVIAVLAHGTFGQDLSVRETMRTVRAQGLSGMARFLTWGRPLGAGRCLFQPVWQLEGADADLAGRRSNHLGLDGASRSAFLWGIACSHFELVLTLGVVGFISLFLPSEDVVNPFALFSLLKEDETSVLLRMVNVAAYGLAAGIVAPFYTAGGFSLYLSRRSQLEAWDIELVLRRLVGRLGKLAAPLALALALLPSALHAGNCPDSLVAKIPVAIHSSSRDAQDQAAQRVVDSLFAQESHRTWACETRWIPDNPATPEVDPETPRLMQGFGEFMVAAAPALKWIFIVGFLGWLVWLLWTHRDLVSEMSIELEVPQGTSSSVDTPIREAPLPRDVGAAALDSWSRGLRREALSILYRATVQVLEERHGLVLAKGSTEGLCLRELARKSGPVREAAEPVVRAWTAAAWADRWPDDDGFRNLVSRWRSYLGNGL
jgi:hypothetical protein